MRRKTALRALRMAGPDEVALLRLGCACDGQEFRHSERCGCGQRAIGGCSQLPVSPGEEKIAFHWLDL